MKQSVRERDAIAYHEAGHAVACIKLRVRVRKATIIPVDADVLGHVSHANVYGGVRLDIETSDRARLRAERDILIALAGDAAERKFCKRRRFGGGADYERAVDAALHLCSSAKATEAFVNWLAVAAADLVESQWAAIERVAKALIERKTLTGAQVREAAFPPIGARSPASLRIKPVDDENGGSWV
jgi:ATP-dependent Zn protease